MKVKDPLFWGLRSYPDAPRVTLARAILTILGLALLFAVPSLILLERIAR